MNYQYDVLGRRTQMVANGQQPVTYQYDPASRLTQVAQGSLAVGLGYDNANRRTSLTYPNGTSTSYAYDVASRLSTINHIGPNGIIEALTNAYDSAGNRTSLTRNNGTASLLPAAVASATYDAANEQTAFAGATLQYDANGNLTSDGTNTYVWDARNRLVAMSGGATANFVYDPLGRRTTKTINSVVSQFAYDGNDIVAEIGGGAVGANYLRSLNIDEPFIRQSSAGNEHYHTDALGSSLALSNLFGATATTYTYEPFGKTAVTGTSTTNAVQYTGRENDGTGLTYYRARYYSPVLSRFLNEDPVREGRGSPNFYPYVGNQPLNFKDPLGLFTWQVGANVTGGFGADLPLPGGGSVSLFDVGFDLGFGVVIDDLGQIGIAGYAGIGDYYGAGASGVVQGQLQGTTAQNIQQLAGNVNRFQVFGGPAPIGIGGSVGGEGGNISKGDEYVGPSGGIGIAVGTPIFPGIQASGGATVVKSKRSVICVFNCQDQNGGRGNSGRKK